MKKALFVGLAIIALAVMLTGCGSLMKSVKEKHVNIDTEIYGFKVTAFDPSTGSMAPVGYMGFGRIVYNSVPMDAGQPFYATHEINSIWGEQPASATKIWIGRASDRSVLTFEAVPAGMIKISSDGISSGTSTLKVTTVEDKSDATKSESAAEPETVQKE